MIYVLTIVIALLLVLVYFLKNGDFMSPSFLITGGFFLCVLFAVPLASKYAIHININTVIMVVLFLLFYYLGDACGMLSLLKYKKSKRVFDVKYIYISKLKTYIYIIFAFATIIQFYFAVVKAVGGSSWLEVMALYRYKTAYQNQTGESVVIPAAISLFRFIVIYCSYLYLYVLINNYLAKKKIEYRYVVAVVIGLGNTLIGASRLDLVRLPIAAIVIFMLISYTSGKIKRNMNIKGLIRVLGIAIIVLFLFSSLRSVVGRSSALSLVEYLGGYIGAPMINLDSFLQKPIRNTDLFGKETFWGIYNFLGNLTKNSKYFYDYTLEFNSINGQGMGNVYTSIRMYYADFGIIGTVILSIVLGFVFSIYYETLSRGKRIVIKDMGRLFPKSVVNFKLIVYSMIIYSVLLAFYADWFYSQVLSWAVVKGIIIIWIAKYILIDLDSRNRII